MLVELVTNRNSKNIKMSTENKLAKKKRRKPLILPLQAMLL
jgi:hypothetical protein